MKKNPLEKGLEETEKEVLKPYVKAQKEIREMIRAYFAKHADEDNEKRAQVEAGELTQEEYRSWRLKTYCSGKEFKAFQEKVAKKYLELNQQAMKTVNEEEKKEFAEGANYNLFLVDKALNGE